MACDSGSFPRRFGVALGQTDWMDRRTTRPATPRWTLAVALAVMVVGCSQQGSTSDGAARPTTSLVAAGATGPSAPGMPFGPPGDLSREPDPAGAGTWWRTRTPSYGVPALDAETVLLNYIEQPGMAGQRRVGLAAYELQKGRMLWHHATDCDLSAATLDGSVTDGTSIWVCTPPLSDGPPQDPRIRAYDVKSGQELWRSDLAYEPISGHVEIAKGRVLIFSVGDFELREARTGRVLVQDGDVEDAVLGPDGVVVARDGGVDVVDFDGKVLRHLDRRCSQVFVAPGGAVIGIGTSVVRWAADGTEATIDANFGDEEMPIALSGDHLVTWVFDGDVRSRDLGQRGKTTWRAAQASEEPPLVFEGRIAVDSGTGPNRLRDIATGRTVASTDTGYIVVSQPRRALVLSDLAGVTRFRVIPVDPN